MKYKNPVLRGMYPDPSLCAANGKFYMVCSTFQYFPGVPVFESDDLINWKQIGNCLTRKSQLLIEKNDTNSGIYAPTIRFNNGRFYMVVTNVENIGNFYVYTDDIYGEWSDPVKVEQSGIDPSLFFDDDGKVYFISNGNDKEGRAFIQMSEIDIATGKKLSENEPLWYGTGGRFIEAPHLYKFGEYYYLLNAEGGTEYGHMVNYARSKNIKGPYEPCPANPILTNRNMGGYPLQGAGHGDIVQSADGTWWFCHLAFRQPGLYTMYHHLGRETCMEPVVWKDDWFYIGTPYTKASETVCGEVVGNGYNEKQGYGQALLEVEAPENHVFAPQKLDFLKTFENTQPGREWCFICNPDENKYKFYADSYELRSGELTIDTLIGSPTFIGLRQSEFEETAEVICEIRNLPLLAQKTAEEVPGQTGFSAYLDPKHHYDLYLEQRGDNTYACFKVTVGPASCVKKEILLAVPKTNFKIIASAHTYEFYADDEFLGSAETRYLSSEVAGGFTGVFWSLYAQNGACGKFTDFKASHRE